MDGGMILHERKKEERFVKIMEEGNALFGAECSLLVDRETGVTYLVVCNSYGTGLTALLVAVGKPVISKL